MMVIMVPTDDKTPNKEATTPAATVPSWWADWASLLIVPGRPWPLPRSPKYHPMTTSNSTASPPLYDETRIDSFSRYCHGRFFAHHHRNSRHGTKSSLSTTTTTTTEDFFGHAQYFECASLIWIVKVLENSRAPTGTDHGKSHPSMTAYELQQATYKVMKRMMTTTTPSGDEEDKGGLASWLLPKLEQEDLLPNLPQSMLLGSDDVHAEEEQEERREELSVQWMLHFWKYVFEVTTTANNAPLPPSSKKRPRTTYHYNVASHHQQQQQQQQRNSLDDLMKGSYKLPTAILCILISLEVCDSWEEVTKQAYGLQKAWKTLTSEDIRAALTVVGLECIGKGQLPPQQARRVEGLTSMLMLEYLTRSGESTLSVLKNALQLDYYHLRAVICEHLLEPVYSPAPSSSSSSWFLTEDQTQTLIRASNDFMNREHPLRFLSQLETLEDSEDATLSSTTSKGNGRSTPPLRDNNGKRKRIHTATTNVPRRITNPRFPLMTHLTVWLLQDNMPRAMELVRHLELSSRVDGLWKDEAYLIIWDHLLRRGQVFLDGNGTHTASYIERREMLYNGVVSGMGPYGRGSMMDFYQTLAQTVWDRPEATMEEKQYVLVACQQTLLRLCLKCRGLGPTTIAQFLRETSWPIACHDMVSTTGGIVDEDTWAMDFLRTPNPIPESLLSVDGILELSPLVDEPQPSSISTSKELQDAEPPLVQPPTLPINSMQPLPVQPGLLESVIPTVPPFSEHIPTHQNAAESVLLETTKDPVNEVDGPEESRCAEQQLAEVYEEEQKEDHDDDDDDEDHSRSYDDDDEDHSRSYDDDENGGEDDEPQFSNGHTKQPVVDPQDEVIELDDHDENEVDEDAYDDDDDDDEEDDYENDDVEGNVDNVGENMHQMLNDQMLGDHASESSDATAERSDDDQLNAQMLGDDASESSDATAERSDDDQAVEDVHAARQLRPLSDGRRAFRPSEDNDSRESDEEKSSVAYEELPQEHRDYSSSSDSEGDEGEEEFSDGEDDDPDDDGVEQEAIVIGDSENEGDYDEVPVDNVVRHQVREHYDRDGVEARHRLDNSDNDSDVQGDDSEDSGPHRIAQGVVRDGSDDESEDEYEEPGDDVNRVEEQGSSDEEHAEAAAHDVAINVAVVDEPFEIIDEDSEGDEIEEQPQIVSKAPENKIGRRTLDEHPESSQGDEYGQDDETIEETSMQELVRPSSNVDQARSSGEDGGEQADEDTKVPAIDGALQNDNLESDATDDEEERVVPDEKADTADAAADGEFGDTTDDENDEVTRSRANQLADTDRRADVLLAKRGYASQLEDGYEPEDTHGYTEEEVSEAIHTEDEEEEWAVVKESKPEISQPRPEILESVQESLHHSSDDMDAADERTVHEEDLAAESSELEENAEPKQYAYSPSPQAESGDPTPTTLLQFAQSAQRLHTYGIMELPPDSTPSKAITQRSRYDDELNVSVEKSVDLSATASVNIDQEDTRKSTSIPLKTEAADNSQLSTEDDQFSRMATTNNFASVEDENEAGSTMATESFEMTEETVDNPDSLDPEVASTKAEDPDIDAHESEAIIDETSTMPSDLPPASPTIGASEEMALDPEERQDMIQVNAMETDTHPAIEEEMDVDENANKGEDEEMIDAEDEVDDVAMEPSLAEELQIVVMDIAQIVKPIEGSRGADTSMEVPGVETFEEQSGVASVTSPIRDVEPVVRDQPRDEVEDAESDEVLGEVDNVQADDALVEDPKANDVLDEFDGTKTEELLDDVKADEILDVNADEMPDEVHDVKVDEMPDEVHDVKTDEMLDEVHDVKADGTLDEVHNVKTDNALDEVDHAGDDDLLTQLGETDPPHGPNRANDVLEYTSTSSRRGKRDKHTSPPSEEVLEDYNIPTRAAATAKTVGEADTESIAESVASYPQTRRGTRSRSKDTTNGEDQSDVSVDMTAQEKKPIARVSTRTRNQAQKYEATDESLESNGPRTRNRGRMAEADEESEVSTTSRTRSRAKKAGGDASAGTNNDERSIVSSTGPSSRERAKSGHADPVPTRSTRGRPLTIVADGDDDSFKGQDEQSIPRSNRRSTRGRVENASVGEDDDSSVPSTIQSTTDYQVATEAAFEDDDSVIGVSSRRSTRSSKRKESSTDVEIEGSPLETLRKSNRRRTSPANAQDDEEEKAPTRISSRPHAGKKAGLPPLPPPRRSARKK